ncbi:hypothetical protein K7X08_021117 [Anisodus acutangulus]|uniref:Uncharacterized protein n=1 Tax=Anisodus acutangulus TaxID=402998 RepID=A0A9Q1RB56_9SOLA|nr:hypothetical protein K7X08_021117 [Anisodus acutangulus]
MWILVSEELPSFVDTGVAVGSSMIFKQAMDLDNSGDNVGGREEHQSGSSSPKRQIAHSELANMLIQHQVASLVCPIPVLKPLMVTLNTSAFEIPTQSMESFDEQHDDSGKQLIPTENDQYMDNIVASTQAHSSNKFGP